MKKTIREVPAEKLRWRCNPDMLHIETTDDVPPSKDIIGQQRALRALELGLKIQHGGYNVFVTGFSGTGRTTTIRRMLHEFEGIPTQLYDHCFVNNFKKTDAPIAVRLRAGEGNLFKEKMEDCLRELKKNLPSLFESRRYQEERKRTMEHFQERQRVVLKEFESKVRARGFEVVQVQAGETMHLDIVPLIEGVPTGFEQIETLIREGKMTRDDVDNIWQERSQLESQLEVISREMRNIDRRARESMEELTTKYALPLVKDAIDDIRHRFNNQKVNDYLNDVQETIIANLERFQQRDEQQSPMLGISPKSEQKDDFWEYKVNVIVDNSRTKGTPIILETNPRFHNLFGTIEFEIDRNGTWHTDFSLIKGGSLLQSDGGFLVVNAMDALVEPGVWHTLKRTLRNGRLEIQTIETGLLGASSALKPEPIEMNVKVIMVGDVDTYYYLYHLDEEFKKIFKVRADFDVEMPRNTANIKRYVSFIKMISQEEKLLAFDKSAIAEVIEEGVRLSEKQNKLSTRFNIISDLMKEANFWAMKAQAVVVTSEHVRTAITEQIRRESLLEEKTREMIDDGTIMIQTEGKVVGQINGLSVYELAGRTFGQPTKITAKTSMGKQGVVSIEREAAMSGPIHNKSVLILSGYLRSLFAQDKPMMMNASIAFEQSYGGIDGDSASSTEIYAILSSLAEIPLRQDIAVTGSVNQHGEVQPIGGVNEKIEGFFDVCRKRGFKKTHGVLIPSQNVKDLMLRHDIIDEVANGNFHIYSVNTINDGIELLTGISMGRRNTQGEFPEGTIGYLANRKLVLLSQKHKELSVSD
ncbi:MAG: ATP-dependent protease [Ignavibacteria bacterium]|nr:ATP-dependent protease [Ignavibacteria bacterium]